MYFPNEDDQKVRMTLLGSSGGPRHFKKAKLLNLAEMGQQGKRKLNRPKSSPVTLKSICVRVQQLLFILVLAMGFCVTIITLHNYSPIDDPIKQVGFLDKLSLFLKVHEQSAVIILDLGLYSSTIYCYIFHRHVSDGSFAISKEDKRQILNGIFDKDNNYNVNEHRIDEIVSTAVELIPVNLLDPQKPELNPPVIAKISFEILNKLGKNSPILNKGVEILGNRLKNESSLQFMDDSSIGTLGRDEENVLQWFSINLLTHKLKHFHAPDSAIILNVGQDDVSVTFAATSRQQWPETNVTSKVHKLTAFGNLVRLVTITFNDLGLFQARYNMLTNYTDHPNLNGKSPIELRSSCMNPIAEAHWRWQGEDYLVLGKEESDYELVKERNGPFAGKKINRPVANYDQCHNLAKRHLSEHVSSGEITHFRNLFRNRQVFMEGLMLEKAMERGLTLPYRGGHARMKLFIESLQHACKVPNTDQPFGCVDLMYLASLMDYLFGFKQSSVLHSSCDVGGMTGEWPLAAAFHIYENGL